MSFVALLLSVTSAFNLFTWVPDPSAGKSPALESKDAVYSNLRVWSPDGLRHYRTDAHFPMIDVTVDNRSAVDSLATVKVFLTFTAPDGTVKDLGERAWTKQFVRAGERAVATLDLKYRCFAEFDAKLGKDKAAKGAYLVRVGPAADDIREQLTVTLDEDIFFDIVKSPERKVKLLKFDPPNCIFKPTPTPCEDFLAPYYGTLSHADYTLLDRAVRTFEWNALGKSCEQKIYVNTPPWLPLRGVNPSSAWFKGVWNWDSAFIMMAVRRWDAELARDQMRIWMLMQNEEGQYPDSWTEGDGILHAPGFYNSKPPIFAWAMWQLHRTAPDRAFLAEAYRSLKKNEGWWRANRLNATFGLFHYDGERDAPEAKRREYAGWESGWDDSPRWDGDAWHVLAIDLNAYLVMTYRALRDFAAELGYEEDRKLWIAREAALAKAMEEHLWDEQDQCYYDRNFVTGKFNRSVTPAGFMPLFIGTASPERAAAMAKQAVHEEPGWPSVAYDDPKYNPMGYWRGRTWINVAYFALKGLRYYGFNDISERGRQTLLAWIRNDPSAIYETYNSRTGLPCGASHFSWSCTFVISFLLDWDLPLAEEQPAK